jgi:hypothetical protein
MGKIAIAFICLFFLKESGLNY